MNATVDWEYIAERAGLGDLAAIAAIGLECEVEQLRQRLAALEQAQGKRLDGGDEWRRLYEVPG